MTHTSPPYTCPAVLGETQIPKPPRCPRIGPLEVLRVALMRGDLDDVRNDMARALAWHSVAPDVLHCLLYGLEGIGIDLSGARATLGARPEPHTAPGRRGGALGGAEREAQGRATTEDLYVACRAGAVPQGPDGTSVMTGVESDHGDASGVRAATCASVKENTTAALATSGALVNAKPAGKRPRRKRSGGRRSSGRR